MINIDKSFRWVSKNYFDTTFARLFLVISLGVIVAEYTALATNIFLVAIVVGFSFMIFSTFRVNQLGKWIFVFSWSLFLFGAGGWLLRQKQMPELPNDTHSYIVELKTTPISKGSYYRADAEIVYANDSIAENLIGHNVLMNIYTDSLLNAPRLCDRYLINTKIFRPDNGGLDGFDYGKYLVRNGLCGVAYLYGNNIKYLSTEQPSGFIQRSYLLRDKLIYQLESVGLKGSQLAIISAITLGEKGLLSNDVRDTFSAAGVSHILVVSGMHVGFIFLIIMWLMSIMSHRRRWIVVVLGLIVLWSYALLTGLAPSVVRATFMFSMMLLFRVIGEKYRIKHALCLSATILILINPTVLFNVGFQLSYLAVCGIVYFYPLLYKRISTLKSRSLRWILSSVAVTVSAQIFTLPIVIYNFNQFPIYFILSNLFVTAFAPFLFLGGIALLPLSYIPHLGVGAGWLMNYVVMIFEYIIHLIVSIPFSTIKIYLSLLEVICLYFVIFCGINWVELRNVFAERFKAPLYFSLSVLLFAFIVLVSDIYYSQRKVLIIPETNRLVVNLFGGDENLLYTNHPDFATERLERTWLKYSCSEPTIITDTTLIANIFTFNDESYLILRDNIFRYRQNNGHPLEIDNLIIDRGVYPSERLFTEFICPKRVILTAGVWHGYLDKYKVFMDEIGIQYHIIAQEGAFIK
ncbi:MAG: ComEC/Rec2 family competence protein [Paludibacteraceae bacterium]|nr:ComEC/Rec2 family competence protein [Paludibacteraceae bacterium]